MTDLPQPLTPADCDLRGLPFMPLRIMQVLQSETFGLSNGDEFKAAFTLWCASWMEVPAASLPADERMLEFLSRAKAWKKVKAVAMRGWILCADGRLYHPVVAANALEAWGKRTDFREKEDNKSTRQQRWREQCQELAEQLRDMGIVPPRGASLTKLRDLLASHDVDDGETQTSTQSVSASTCVDGVEIGKTETVKRQITTSPSTPSTPAFDPKAELTARGVSDETANDWLDLRKAKKAKVSPTALKGIIAEANKAGLPLERALSISCRRGWVGFEASWLKAEDMNPASPAPKKDWQ